ncbi:MAG: MlaD family protein [Candidatus Omnitrophota bacterium]
MKITNEMKIGIMVTIVAGMLLVLTFQVGSFSFTKKGYEGKIYFNNIDGVELNAPVRLNGLEIGLIKDIKLVYDSETKMELTVWLDEKAKLREGAQAYIKIMGMLGEKYVELTAGEKETSFLQPGFVIVGVEPVNFERLLAKGDSIATSLDGIAKNLNERLTVNRQALDDIVANLNLASKNLEELSGDLKVNPWKLLYKPKEKK